MKFDPITKDVYTDNGEFVKTLNCPFKIGWDNLDDTKTSFRNCPNCKHLIIDTESLTDESLILIVRQNPKTCLKIDLNQHNLKIISNGAVG